MVHFRELSGGESKGTHLSVFKYYHIENQEKAGGIDVDKFAREHNLLKFTFVRHPFGRYPCTGSHC